MLATGTHHIRSGALHWHHTFCQKKHLSYFPLKKEETNQLEIANSRDNKVIVLPWLDHWLAEALINKEDIPTFITVQLSFILLTAIFYSPMLLWSSQVFTWHEDRDSRAFCSIFIIQTFSMHSAKQHSGMTTIEWQQKPHIQSYNTSTNIMKNDLGFFSPFYTKSKGFGNQYCIFPLVLHEVLIMLEGSHNAVMDFTTVPWFWIPNIWERTDAQQ